VRLETAETTQAGFQILAVEDCGDHSIGMKVLGRKRGIEACMAENSLEIHPVARWATA